MVSGARPGAAPPLSAGASAVNLSQDPTAPGAFPSLPASPRTALLLLAAAFAASLAGSLLLLKSDARLWALAPLQVVALLGPALAWAFAAGALREAFPFRLLSPRGMGGAALVLAGASAGALAFALAVTAWRGPDPWEEGLRLRLLDYPYPLRMALFALIPAVCEEGLFRGAVLHCFRPLGRTRACGLSALSFAAFHLNLAQFLPVLVLGLAFAWVVWETGSLWPSIVGHGLHNALVLALLGGTVEEAAARTTILLAVGLAAGGLLAAFAGWRLMSRAPKGLSGE